MRFRFRKIEPVEPVYAPGFPIKLYLVGVAGDGTEVARTDLKAEITTLGQDVHLENVVYRIEVGE